MLCDASRRADRLSSTGLNAFTNTGKIQAKPSTKTMHAVCTMRGETIPDRDRETQPRKPSLITIQSSSQIPRSPHQLLVLVFLHLQLALPLHADS